MVLINQEPYITLTIPLPTFLQSINSFLTEAINIPVAVLPKTQVCGCSTPKITGSKLSEVLEVCFF
jgi:hypothetical protein